MTRPPSDPPDSPAGEGIPPELADAVRLVVLDVDGVLTDGGVYIGAGADGEALELKRFDILDGLGVKLMRMAGIEVAIVSGRVSPATSARAAELGIGECHQDPGAAKLPVVRGILDRLDVPWSSVAMVGDDLPDIPVMRRAGLPIGVANSVEEVRREVVWSTSSRGGEGAVREFARALLTARGQWDGVVAAYLGERDDG